MRRGSQPDDLRTKIHQPVVPVMCLVMECDVNGHSNLQLTIYDRRAQGRCEPRTQQTAFMPLQSAKRQRAKYFLRPLLTNTKRGQGSHAVIHAGKVCWFVFHSYL